MARKNGLGCLALASRLARNSFWAGSTNFTAGGIIPWWHKLPEFAGSPLYLGAGDLVRQREPMAELISTSKAYRDLLAHLKTRIQTAQVRAAVAVNQELVMLYWQIGKEILTRQRPSSHVPRDAGLFSP